MPDDRLSLDDRKSSILRAVVEEYISTAQPVGSGHVAAAPGVAVSPATVRNDMATLEQDGFLAQPHTSAGRIPTEKGYRYFVDHLTGEAILDRASKQQVRAFFDRAHGELERVLADTSRLLSDLTNTTAVVVGPPHETATVRSVQVVGLNARVALLVAVFSNGTVEKHTVESAEPVEPGLLADAGAHLTAELSGHHLDQIGSVSAPGRPELDAFINRLARSTSGKGTRRDADLAPDQVYVGGAARVASAFEAVDTVRQVLTILEEQLVVVTLLRDVLDRGLSVAIGSETGMAPLAECALVVAPYEVDGEPAGSVGVLGPTRMDYPQALASVAVVSRRLGRRLSEG